MKWITFNTYALRLCIAYNSPDKTTQIFFLFFLRQNNSANNETDRWRKRRDKMSFIVLGFECDIRAQLLLDRMPFIICLSIFPIHRGGMHSNIESKESLINLRITLRGSHCKNDEMSLWCSTYNYFYLFDHKHISFPSNNFLFSKWFIVVEPDGRRRRRKQTQLSNL